MMRYFDQQNKKLDELMDKTRETRQCLAGLEQDVRQPRLTMEADVISDKKTRKRTEDARTDGVVSGDKSSAQVDHYPMSLTGFGDNFTEPPVLFYCRDDALVDKGAAALKPCLSPVEMRTLTAAGGFLTTGTAFTATRTIFHQTSL